MKKNILIAALVLAVIILGVMVWKNGHIDKEQNTSQPSVSQEITSMGHQDADPYNDYFLIPEFKLRFPKIPGFTPIYTIKNNTIHFSSVELQTAAANDPAMNGCVSDWLPVIEITTIKAPSEGFQQIDFGNGKYANISGGQSICFTDKATQQDQNLAFSQRNILFKQFVSSMQPYDY